MEALINHKALSTTGAAEEAVRITEVTIGSERGSAIRFMNVASVGGGPLDHSIPDGTFEFLPIGTPLHTSLSHHGLLCCGDRVCGDRVGGKQGVGATGPRRKGTQLA